MFILAVLAVLIVTGVISFGRQDLTFKTGSQDALYDGSPLTNHEFEMVGELKEGHRIEYEFISSQTVVGESPNELQYKIYDELDADVTADYNIKHEYGTLKVNPRIVLVICEDTRNRIPREDEYYVDEEAYDGLVYDHKLVFRETLAESSDSESSTGEETTIQQTGSNEKRWKPVVFDRNNNDVTANYHIIVNVNVNKGGADSGEIETGEQESVKLDGEDLAEEIFDGDTNLIPPAGNENSILFSIKADNKNKIYLKIESYGEYDGQEWMPARNYYHLMQNAYSASYLTAAALQAGGVQQYRASIISHCGIYALPYYLSLVSGTEVQPSDVVYSGSTDSEYEATYYLYNSAVKLPAEFADYEADYSEFVYGQYLEIDKTSLEYMNGIIEDEGFDANDPEIINKVAKYIQGAADYNMKYDRTLDKADNVAIAFLDDYREGVCSHYASAATLLYRALGIPARYTVGAVAYPNGENYVNVPAKNAHAWVEVYVDGLGWIYVEVTGVVAGKDVEVGQSPSGATECEIYGHDMREVDAKEATCTEIGWSEHSMCAREDCDYKEGYEEIPKLGHDKKVIFAVDPTCTEGGNEEYIMCTRCDCLWAEDGKTELKEIPVLDALGHDMVYVPRKEPTCVDDGTDEHYMCTRCECVWDVDGVTQLAFPPTIGALGHNLVYVEALEPDCENGGNDAYYYCMRCNLIFDRSQEKELDKIPTISALGHDLEFVPEKLADCETFGNQAYYYCKRCGAMFAEDGITRIEKVEVTDALGHIQGTPRADDHCNVYCERCGELLAPNMHSGETYIDTEDGNKRKCVICHDEIRQGTKGESGVPDDNRVIYTVVPSTSSPIYLRETSRNYVGEGFVVVPEFWEVYGDTIPYSPNYLASLIAQASGGKPESVKVLVSADGGYGLPTFMWIGSGYEIQKNDIQYQGNADAPYSVPYFSYDFLNGQTPVIPDDATYAELELVYREFVYKTYLGLDNDTRALADSIIQKQGWSYDKNGAYADKIAVINSVADYVRGYRNYDISYKAPAFDESTNWAEVFFDKDTYPDAEAVCRHYAVAAITLYKELGIPARYASGVYAKGQPNKILDITGENRHAWVEIYIDGIGWIIVDPTASAPIFDMDGNGSNDDESKPQVTITVGNDKVKYQGGKEITYTNNDPSFCKVSGLPYGYTCEYSVIGWASEPGRQRVLQAYNVNIFDVEGNNVTGDFRVLVNEGYLQVYRDTIYLVSNSYERIFNGKTPAEADGGVVTHTKGTLASGHAVKITFTGNSGVGTFANSFTVKVFDGKEDVSDEYLYSPKFGEVKTTPKPIVLTAGSASKEYDGKELTCHEIVYEPGALVDGHSLDLEECEFVGSQKRPGTSTNTITKVKIVDSAGKDVSKWYEISFVNGTLTVN